MKTLRYSVFYTQSGRTILEHDRGGRKLIPEVYMSPSFVIARQLEGMLAHGGRTRTFSMVSTSIYFAASFAAIFNPQGE
jgi:hypothetical protein